MNRFGWIVLATLVGIVAVFMALIRPGGDRPAPAAVSQQVAPAPERLPSGLVVPVTGVAPSALTDTFGQARDNGARAHHGLDIMAPSGTPIVAAAGGTVEKIFASNDGGNTLYVRSPDGGWIFYYAHLLAYAPGLREGARVPQGQLLGTVGATGNASAEGPHLHFEIKRMAPGESWHGGTPINPHPLLAARATDR